MPQEEELHRNRLAQERASGQKRTYGNHPSEIPVTNTGMGKPQNLDHLKNSNYTLGDSYGHAERLKNARESDRNKDATRHGAFGETAKSLKKVAKGSKMTAPLEAFSLARKLRKDVENHESSPWIIALVTALSCDFVFDMIPVAGWVIALFFRPFLFIFLWGKGSWKIKLLYYALLLLDFFPIIKYLPLSTACVLYAFIRSKGKAKFATKLLEELKLETKHYLQNIRNAYQNHEQS